MTEFSWWAGGQVDFLDTPDGRVAYRHWPEAKDAARTLLGIHGLGGNNDNFIALGEALKPHVAVYAIDLAGNGDSGMPGDVASREVHFRNLDALAALIQARHPNARRFVAGYSLGAAYAPAWLARNGRGYSGMLLFAPPYRNVFTPPLHLAIAFRLLSRLTPQHRISVRTRSNHNVDPRYLFEMQSEKFIPARTLRSLRVAADIVPEGRHALPHVTIPTLIIHGEADQAAFPEGARLAYGQLGTADKTLRWIPGAKHDLYDVLSGIKSSDVTDDQRRLVIDAVREWLASH